jgi:hypothetical protein
VNDDQIDRLAAGTIVACLVAILALLLLALAEAQAGEFQRSTVFVAVTLFLMGLTVFVYERAFTPGVVWVLKDGKRAGLIVGGEVVLDPEHLDAK